ncbi:MAG: hypothetical protein GY913_05450 [Proteobacteria bacterium]|nr:hypothetical protein [Pseudomonadota bacterium]MCP4916348.1 hypothetical protein [Pseudomonadota bacterium]
MSVSSAVELEALQGIVQINGGLTLRDIEDAGNLWHLSCLETVGENLVIEHDELRDVDELADLVSVGTNLTVSDNDQQVRLEMAALQSIGGDLRVDRSPAMEQILFGALQVADDVDIDVDALELDLTQLDDARVDVRNVQIEDLSAFASLHTGNLYIDGPALTSLAGLPDGGTYSTVYVGYAPHITSL